MPGGTAYPVNTSLTPQPLFYFPGRYYLVGFLAILLWLPIPVGSATAWGWLTTTVVLAGLIGLYIRQHTAYALEILLENRWVIGVWSLLAGWHLILLFPLTEGMLEWLRPLRAQLAFAEANDWLALTYSTSDTFTSLLRTLSYWGLFTLTLLLFRSAARVKLLLRCVAAVGLFEMLYAALPVFLELDRSLVLDLPIEGGATGTFLRQIGYGHIVFMALCAVLGLLVIRIKPSAVRTMRQRIRRIVKYFFSKKAALRIAALLLFGGMVMAGQYTLIWLGAIATLLSALAGYLLFSPRPKLFSTFMLSLLAANIITIIVATYLADRATPPPPPIITQEDAQWPHATPDVLEHWFLGSGPGTAKDGETDQVNLPVSGVLPIAQDDVSQFVAEFGVPVSLLYAGMFLWCTGCAVMAMARRRHLIFRGAALSCTAALSGTALLALYDSPLQSPANAAYVSVMLGLSLVCLQCRKYQRA